MRNLLMAGAAAGLFIALGAANAYAVPQNSPYATMVPPGAVDDYGQAPDSGYYAAPVEGRSAYIDPDYDNGDDYYYGGDYSPDYGAPVVGVGYYGVGGGGHFHG